MYNATYDYPIILFGFFWGGVILITVEHFKFPMIPPLSMNRHLRTAPNKLLPPRCSRCQRIIATTAVLSFPDVSNHANAQSNRHRISTTPLMPYCPRYQRIVAALPPQGTAIALSC